MQLVLASCEVRSLVDAAMSHRLPSTRTTARSGSTCATAFRIPTRRRDARAFIRRIAGRDPETDIRDRRRRARGRRHRLRAPRRRGARVGRNRLLARRAVLGPRHRDRGADGDHALRDRSHRADAHVCRAVCVERGVVPRARKGGLRARGAGCAAAPSRTASSPISCSTRSSRRKPIGRDAKAEAEPAILRRVGVAQRAAGAVGVEVPAAAANHALVAGSGALRIDRRRPALYGAYQSDVHSHTLPCMSARPHGFGGNVPAASAARGERLPETRRRGNCRCSSPAPW